jgi:hypothetical protein
MPPRKDRLVCLDFPAIKSLEDIPLGMTRILSAITEGSIAPQVGEALARILTGCANALNTLDLQRRVEKLEGGVPHDDDKVTIVKEYR